MSASLGVQVRRVYDAPLPTDGSRVLVDRLWPRGVSKEKAHLDLWLTGVAPSPDLRKWYGHDPARFAEFAERYERELHQPEGAASFGQLRGLADHGQLTLLTATRNPSLSEAAVLATLLGTGRT